MEKGLSQKIDSKYMCNHRKNELKQTKELQNYSKGKPLTLKMNMRDFIKANVLHR